jgi:hypothetical protein
MTWTRAREHRPPPCPGCAHAGGDERHTEPHGDGSGDDSAAEIRGAGVEVERRRFRRGLAASASWRREDGSNQIEDAGVPQGGAMIPELSDALAEWRRRSP